MQQTIKKKMAAKAAKQIAKYLNYSGSKILPSTFSLELSEFLLLNNILK